MKTLVLEGFEDTAASIKITGYSGTDIQIHETGPFVIKKENPGEDHLLLAPSKKNIHLHYDSHKDAPTSVPLPADIHIKSNVNVEKVEGKPTIGTFIVEKINGQPMENKSFSISVPYGTKIILKDVNVKKTEMSGVHGVLEAYLPKEGLLVGGNVLDCTLEVGGKARVCVNLMGTLKIIASGNSDILVPTGTVPFANIFCTEDAHVAVDALVKETILTVSNNGKIFVKEQVEKIIQKTILRKDKKNSCDISASEIL